MQKKLPPSVVMIAGEASGDLHGAHVINSLRKRYDRISISGAGGSAMETAGAELIVNIRQLSVMGFTAIIGKAPQLLNALRSLKQEISKSKPDLVILIDFPDFNLHIAGYAKKLGIPVLYYISPQLWAWRSRRVYKIKRRVDHMAVILPFEQTFYEKYNVPVTFVGHPLMDGKITHAPPLPQPSDNEPISIALLPGSRESEVTKLLPEMLKAAGLLQKKRVGLRILISKAPTIEASLISNIVKNDELAYEIEVTDEPVYKLFSRSHLTIVTSGTASLEAAIFGIPAILVYAMSGFSYTLGRLLIQVPHIGLANLIARQRIIPELIQKDVSADKIADVALKLLTDPKAYQEMQVALAGIKKLMGKPGASDRVAEIAGELMTKPKMPA